MSIDPSIFYRQIQQRVVTDVLHQLGLNREQVGEQELQDGRRHTRQQVQELQDGRNQTRQQVQELQDGRNQTRQQVQELQDGRRQTRQQTKQQMKQSQEQQNGHLQPSQQVFSRLQNHAQVISYSRSLLYELATARASRLKPVGLPEWVPLRDAEPSDARLKTLQKVSSRVEESVEVSSSPVDFGRFFNNKKYADIMLVFASYINKNGDKRLVFGSQKFYAHRLVLSSWSYPLKRFLLSPASEYEGLHRYTLFMDNECWDFFEDFLRFMYTGTLSISGDSVMPLLYLSNKYEVQELSGLCEQFLVDLQRDVASAVVVLRQAIKFNMQEIVKSCLRIIRSNFELIAAEQLKCLDGKLIVDLLKHEQSLVVSNEFAVYEKLTPWLQDCSDDEIFMSVVDCIRFPFMSALNLSQVVTSDVGQRILKLRSRFMIDAFQQHTLYREAVYQELQDPIPHPHLYLGDIGQALLNDNFVHISKADPDTYYSARMNTSESIRNTLQEITHYGGHTKTLFIRDYSAWSVNFKYVSADNVKWGLKVKVRHAHKGKGKNYHRHGRVEVAVQVKFEDGLTHLVSAERSDISSCDDFLFELHTPQVLPTRPFNVRFRAVVLVHGDVRPTRHGQNRFGNDKLHGVIKPDQRKRRGRPSKRK